MTVFLALAGSSALFGFVQFMITRKDKKSEKIDYIVGQVDSINSGLHDLRRKVEENDTQLREEMLHDKAITARVRILRASDEIRLKMRHSEEWFDQMNEDITFYETYCRDNPGFKNNKAVHAIANINSVYAKALKDNDFL